MRAIAAVPATSVCSTHQVNLMDTEECTKFLTGIDMVKALCIWKAPGLTEGNFLAGTRGGSLTQHIFRKGLLVPDMRLSALYFIYSS